MAPRYYHFSVDDVLDGLLSLTTSTRSLTESHLIAYFEELHDKFASQVDFYLFMQRPRSEVTDEPLCDNNVVRTGPASLADLPATLAPLFAQIPWLRLGPHALDRDTPPHAQTLEDQLNFLEHSYQQIIRFAGSNCVSPWVRLHYFSECYELAPKLNQYGTCGLLTTDKPALSYRLPAPQIDQLRSQGRTTYNDLEFIRSHVRIENLADRLLSEQALDAELDAMIDQAECAVIFTHEYELLRPEVREMTHRVFQWITKRNLRPVYDSLMANRNVHFAL